METYAFQDFDAFAGTVRDVDCGMMLRNPTRRRWVINHVYLPQIHVQLGRLGSGNIVEGRSWPNGYLLYLPLTDACAYSANGTVLDKGSFFVLEPGCEFCVSTEFAHDWCTIFVPTDLLDPGSDLAEPSSGSEKMICRVTRPNRQVANQFQALVHQVMTTATQCPQFESSPAATGAVADLLKVASVVIGKRLGHEPAREGRPRLQREETIRSSRELREQRDGEPVLDHWKG